MITSVDQVPNEQKLSSSPQGTNSVFYHRIPISFPTRLSNGEHSVQKQDGCIIGFHTFSCICTPICQLDHPIFGKLLLTWSYHHSLRQTNRMRQAKHPSDR